MNKDTNETEQSSISIRHCANDEQAEKIISKAVSIVSSIIQAQGFDFKTQNLETMIKSAASSVSNVYNMMFGATSAAVDIESSVTEDYIVCLENGAKVKMLRKYLKRFGMSAEDYRRKWSLPANYPFVAPAYSKRRRELAHKAKLGYMRQINGLKKKAA